MDAQLFETMVAGVVGTPNKVKISFPNRQKMKGNIIREGDALFIQEDTTKPKIKLVHSDVIAIQKLN